MIIGGFQKLSLVDYPNKVAVVVFMQGCSFRCPYCHNPELIPIKKRNKPRLSREAGEIFKYLEKKKYFLDGVCITGGEPTLHDSLPDFIKQTKELGLLVKLDTNGSNPTMIKKLIKNKLVDYLAMDLKSSWENYDKVININDKKIVNDCKKTFKIIQASNIDHEFRTTVFPAIQTKKDFIKIASYLGPGEKYYLQNIKYKKNLDKKIDKKITLNVSEIASSLQKAFPQVIIKER